MNIDLLYVYGILYYLRPFKKTGFPASTVYTGADPGFLVSGGVEFFSKAWGRGAALRPPLG